MARAEPEPCEEPELIRMSCRAATAAAATERVGEAWVGLVCSWLNAGTLARSRVWDPFRTKLWADSEAILAGAPGVLLPLVEERELAPGGATSCELESCVD